MNPDADTYRAATKSKPLPGLQITISRIDTEEVFTTLTNEKGCFNFANLRSGEWNIRVNADQLPARHYLNMNEITFTLAPEEDKKAAFEVLPIPLKILPLEK